MGGGLAIYVDKHYTISERNSDCIKTNTCEGMFVEISGSNINHKILLGNIYKPPRNNNNHENIETFITDIEPTIQKLCSSFSDIIIAGDFNISLLQINDRPAFSNFYDKMVGYSLFPQITLPTRLSKHSGSLIDNIYCKLSNNTIDSISGIIVFGRVGTGA